MLRDFEIFHLNIHHNRGLIIFARHLGIDHNFNVPDGSLLGDLPILNYTETISTSISETLSPDVFVFRPLNVEHLFYREFSIGQKISLNIVN
jgi:hypothetical protein